MFQTLIFGNVGRLSQKVEGSTAGRLLRFYEKRWYEYYIKHNTKKSRTNRKRANLELTNDLSKTSRSQRHSNYYVFVKTRVRPGRAGSNGSSPFLEPLLSKMVSKRCFFENPENRKGHLKPIFYKSLELGPSKNSPRERFCKITKEQREIYKKMKVVL